MVVGDKSTFGKGTVQSVLELNQYLPPEYALPDLRMIIYSLALILMMILRPQGLFGLHEIWNFRIRRSSGSAKRAVA